VNQVHAVGVEGYSFGSEVHMSLRRVVEEIDREPEKETEDPAHPKVPGPSRSSYKAIAENQQEQQGWPERRGHPRPNAISQRIAENSAKKTWNILGNSYVTYKPPMV
jgi:hypothetical protein